MEPFELLIHLDALQALRKVRGESRKQLKQFLSALPGNPYLKPDTTYEDRKGRMVSKIRIHSYVLEFIVDDPVQEIKIIELTKVPDK